MQFDNCAFENVLHHTMLCCFISYVKLICSFLYLENVGGRGDIPFTKIFNRVNLAWVMDIKTPEFKPERYVLHIR